MSIRIWHQSFTVLSDLGAYDEALRAPLRGHGCLPDHHGRPLGLTHINPSVSPFKVAAARVEQSSLRKMLSMCVRTVLGLMSSSCVTRLLLAPPLISSRMRHSRVVSIEAFG
jgi:hypothetical protein